MMQNALGTASQADLAQQYAGLVQQAQGNGYLGKPEPLVTLGSVADRHEALGKSLYEAEHRLASLVEHVSGLSTSTGGTEASQKDDRPRGVVGRLDERARSTLETASRVHSLINGLMTHLGMNEPTAINGTRA